MNETDVREDVIAPLVNQLGYKTGSENNIIREQSLRYPKISLGRKDQRKDPELRGKADYILEVGSRLRWVIEAKAPAVAIDTDSIEQAWTYANHPEIRAIYFVLCNGRTLSIFRTPEGPNTGAVLSLSYDKFDSQFQMLAGLLSPEALVRDFPSIKADGGLPIAPGLRSLARIANGLIRFERNSLGLGPLNEIQLGISGGSVERDENGKLIAFLETVAPMRSLQEVNERLGLAKFEMVGADSVLSTNAQSPTVFSYRNVIILPAGEEVLNLLTWSRVSLPTNVTCHVEAEARGAYRERLFSGVFATRYEFGISLDVSGSFEIHLA